MQAQKKSSAKADHAARKEAGLLSFADAYARLSDEQRLAVDTIEGPVMVVAGPGSGKTQVLALRAANILRKTHMRPSNILCLTFSLSGATAMRERLRRYIGADAYGIEVSTVHGFCNDLMQRHPEIFEDFGRIEQLSDIERFYILNTIIDQLPPHSAIISPKDRYGRTADILARISDVKREGISIDRLDEVAKLYRAEMETKSRPGTKVHERNLKLASQYEDFVMIFKRYQETLQERGRYDYDDMILRVIAALKEEEWLRASLQERYQYVLVDEMQDLNGAQHQVVELLTSVPEGVGEPNIFIVGDDDQAIYRFQGASVEGMIAFRNRFSACPVITLTASFRSTQEILDAATSLIAHNTVRIASALPGITKKLVSHRSDAHGPEPVLKRPVSDVVEPAAIAEWIAEFAAAGIPLGEIAVLTRANRELFELYDAFAARGIPAQLTGKLDLMAHPVVREVIALLKAVASPKDDHLFAAGISIAALGCHPADIAELIAQQRLINDRRRGQDIARDSLSTVANLIEFKEGEWGLRNAACLTDSRNLILDLHEKLSSRTLPSTLEHLLKQSGLLPRTSEDIDPLDLAALQAFFDVVRMRCHDDLAYDIHQLIGDIETRERYGIALQYAVPHIVDDGVQLMTAHGSKGLEFDIVIIPQFRDKHWGNRRARATLSMPTHLLFGDEADMDMEDERRLAYVAWTRARKQLIFSCPERITRAEREQAISPSQFFVEAGALPEAPYEVKDIARVSTLLLKKFDVASDKDLQSFLRHRLSAYALSVSALNKFLDDPERFLAEDLLLMPQARNFATAYGISVHAALLAWGRSVKSGPLSKHDVIVAFKNAVEKREVLTAIQRSDMLHLGAHALDRYYDARLAGRKPEIYGLEKPLMARLGDIPLTGKLDRIDLYAPEGAAAHIIDYKTGAPKTERDVREKDGGAMYRQLVFYKLLSDISPAFAGYNADELSLDFIGERADEPKLLTFSIPPPDIAELKRLIEKVWAKLIALDFTPIDVPA